MRNQKIKFKDNANEMRVSETATNKLFNIGRNLATLVHHQSQEDPRIISIRLDGSIRGLSEIDRIKTAVETISELKKFQGPEISVHAVRRRLRESGLNARIARRVPLISLKNRKCRLNFARKLDTGKLEKNVF